MDIKKYTIYEKPSYTHASSDVFGFFWAVLGFFEWMNDQTYVYRDPVTYIISIPTMITTTVLDTLGFTRYLDSWGLIMFAISVAVGIVLFEIIRRFGIALMDYIITSLGM